MSNRKCPNCGKTAKPRKTKYDTGIHSKPLGKNIIAKGTFFHCKACDYSWMPASEMESIAAQISRETWQSLNGGQVAELRKSLGLGTKSEAATFLGLNMKAFSRWELGYHPTNLSSDLLLRLVAHSKENLKFVEDLHRKHFAYERSDYQLVCEKVGTPWRYDKWFSGPTSYVKLEDVGAIVKLSDEAIRKPFSRESSKSLETKLYNVLVKEDEYVQSTN